MEPKLVTPRDSDVHLGRVLVSLGYASDADEAARLARQARLPLVDLPVAGQLDQIKTGS